MPLPLLLLLLLLLLLQPCPSAWGMRLVGRTAGRAWRASSEGGCLRGVVRHRPVRTQRSCLGRR